MTGRIEIPQAGLPVASSFVRSLLWLAVAVSCATTFWIVVDIVNVDFLHFNPHRSRANVIQMLLLFPPLFTLVALIGVALVFGIPHILQTYLASFLLHRYGKRGLTGVALCLPLLSMLTCYCYDYLTPSDFNFGFNTGADWEPYQHGLNGRRYLQTLLAQSAVTLFSLARLWLELHDRKRMKTLLLVAVLSAAACYGSVNAFTRQTSKDESASLPVSEPTIDSPSRPGMYAASTN